MKVNGFEQVHELACKAFYVGESLVLRDEKKLVSVQPCFYKSEPAIRVTSFGSDLKEYSDIRVSKDDFNDAMFDGLDVPDQIAEAIQKGVL